MAFIVKGQTILAAQENIQLRVQIPLDSTPSRLAPLEEAAKRDTKKIILFIARNIKRQLNK